MHAIESGEHRYRIVAPQSSVAPDDVFRHAHDPAGDTGIAGVDKLPSAPVFLPRGRPGLIRIVIRTMTKLFFVTVVFLARQKSSTLHVLSGVGFERPVLGCL